MVSPMAEALPESPVPEIAQEDIGEVPGIETDVTKVACYKIDPLTGKRDPSSIDLTEIVSVGKYASEGCVKKDNALYMFFS